MHIPQQRKVIFSISLTRRIEKHYFLIYLRKSRNSSIKIGNRVPRISHSHISLLNDMGFSAVAIADRVGHESIDITYQYAHVFESTQKAVATKLDEMALSEGFGIENDRIYDIII